MNCNQFEFIKVATCYVYVMFRHLHCIEMGKMMTWQMTQLGNLDTLNITCVLINNSNHPF